MLTSVNIEQPDGPCPRGETSDEVALIFPPATLGPLLPGRRRDLRTNMGQAAMRGVRDRHLGYRMHTVAQLQQGHDLDSVRVVVDTNVYVFKLGSARYKTYFLLHFGKLRSLGD